MKNNDDNMKVFVRVRPFNQKESNTQTLVSSLNQKSIKIKDKQSQHQFAFDHIFDQHSVQSEVYQKVGKQVVQSAFQGFNGTIFAYGQTSSGKTHTCIGPDYQDQLKKGILPRLISNLFEKINESVPYIEYRIKISMVEIYMQKIKDLFDLSKNDLKIRQNKTKGIYLQDVTQQYVASTAQALNYFKKGIANRTVGQTNMNDVSSRSHMAFLITLYQNNLKDASAKSGKIILVDLAGSQKVSKTQAQGKVLDQAKQINKSLSSLGNVITALTDAKISHIPYRDSKLTRLLQQSLGGNSKTNLIINISPSSYNFGQSLSSLRFGFRAKQIKNKPKVNRQYTVAQLLMLLQKAQKKNQQLQQIIKQLTTSKKKTLKKQGPSFMQNLLDSDNPILSGLSQNQGEEKEQVFKKQLSGIKQVKFQSQCEDQTTQKKQFTTTAFNEEKQQLIQMVQQLTFQKNELTRQYQLMEQKFQQASKQARLLTNKLNSYQKQNQKFLQKLISSKLEVQQKQKIIKKVQQKLESYQESISQLISLKQSKSSKIFGNNSGMLSGTQKIIKKYQQFHFKNQPLGQIEQNQQIKSPSQLIEQKDKKIKQLSHQIQVISQDLTLYKSLDQSKEQFIKQKMKFTQEKQRVYFDLQNRIQKVLELQEKLDQEKQKNKFLSQIVDSSQSQKGRKIVNMQKHLEEISENYYVLKGQQSSWLNNNKRYEKKIQKKDQKIAKLEQQIIELRHQIQNLKLNSQDLQELRSQLDFDFSVNEQENEHQQGKIVKVLKSNIFH